MVTDTALITETPNPPAPPFDDRRLVLRAGLAMDQWWKIGGALRHMEENVQWWIGDWWLYGEREYGEMASQAAKGDLKDKVGYEYKTIRTAGWVAARFEFDRRRSNSTKLTFAHFAEVAALERQEADTWLDRAEAGDIDGVTGEAIPWTRQRLRAEVRAARLNKEYVARALPPGQFNVIYADPPWQYEFAESDTRDLDNQYPQMDLIQIRDLTDADGRSVADAVAPDAILFLWTTSPKLEEAISVVEAWGFTYRTNLVWVKDRIGMGYYARQRHELLLVCKRGDFPAPPATDRPDSVIEWPRMEHSQKPDLVYELIERMYPNATRLELFARRPRDGWAQWGNEPGVNLGNS